MQILDDFTGEADFIIVGSGVAGLRAAIALATAGRILILTKAEPSESNTGYAQGGIAAAFGDDDSPALHLADTLAAGDGLCDSTAVEVLVSEGPRYVAELLDWGARFDRDARGRPALGREAAHSVRRILHAGDATGREIARTLWNRATLLPSITSVNHALVTELLVDNSRPSSIRGVRFFNHAGEPREAKARAVLLATGGAGQVFRETTNPTVATGDGIALAYRAAALVADLEFVQFHPTALKLSGAPRFLLSEALRGEGARLVNQTGEAFMPRYHRAADLAPRDVVARSIVREEARTGGPVFLSLAHLDAEYIRRRFPTITESLVQLGLDLGRDRIPVGPAAHYIMGGVATDCWGRTSIAGLFAAGEVACTGVHGANRLASNSLLEGLVFGARAAVAMQQPPEAATIGADWRIVGADARVGAPAGVGAPLPSPSAEQAPPVPATGYPTAFARSPIADMEPPLEPAAVRDLMWRAAGLFRTREGLAAAVDRLRLALARHARQVSPSAASEVWQQGNLLVVAWLIARAALRRQESRGGHFREDFPERDDIDWKVHLADGAGR